MRNLAIIFLSTLLFTSNVIAYEPKIVATYSGGNITDTQITEQFKPMLDMQPQSKDKKFFELDKNLQELLIKSYISQKLLAQEADKQGIKDQADFKEKLKSKLQLIESQMLQQELISNYLKTAVTDKMVEDEYKKFVDGLKGQKEIKTSHILVNTEEEAKELKKKLDKGTKFEALAKEFSKDEGSKANAGELGYVRKGQFVPEFESKAFSMKVGEISDPVKTQFGWHIIKIIDSRDIKLPTKEQLMEEIRAKLSNEAVESYVSKLYNQANVKLSI
jgi:parvulin-like peptidyl-prolyl isomerase